jgi:hypothetical protein
MDASCLLARGPACQVERVGVRMSAFLALPPTFGALFCAMGGCTTCCTVCLSAMGGCTSCRRFILQQTEAIPFFLTSKQFDASSQAASATIVKLRCVGLIAMGAPGHRLCSASRCEALVFALGGCWQGSELPPMQQARLTAPRILRIHKVAAYARGKLNEEGIAVSTSPRATESPTRGQASQYGGESDAYREPDDGQAAEAPVLELVCNGMVRPQSRLAETWSMQS